MFQAAARSSWPRIACMLLLAAESGARADVFHYANFIAGDRAIGLGGAYTALSNDASGVVYNPAGLAFAETNEISGSANAFFSQKTTYKKALGNADFTEDNGGSLSPFVGGLYRLEDKVPGLAAGFAIYATDNAVKNQNQFIREQDFQGSTISRLHREVHETSATGYYGGAVSKLIGKTFSVGLGASILMVDELSQSYQDIGQKVTTASVVATKYTTRAIRTELGVKGLEPVLGFRFAVTQNMFLGLAIKKAVLLSQGYQYDLEESSSLLDASNKVVAGAATDPDVAIKRISTKVEKPLKDWPAEIRGGVAYSKAQAFTLALDVSHHLASTGGDPSFDRKAVTNVAAGFEAYPAAIVAVRGGVFTNRDARAVPKAGGSNQPDHIDYTGATLSAVYVSDEKQISAGVVYQSGSGKAQKLGAGPIQDVTSSSTTIILASSYNLGGEDDECAEQCKKARIEKRKMDKQNGT